MRRRLLEYSSHIFIFTHSCDILFKVDRKTWAVVSGVGRLQKTVGWWFKIDAELHQSICFQSHKIDWWEVSSLYVAVADFPPTGLWLCCHAETAAEHNHQLKLPKNIIQIFYDVVLSQSQTNVHIQQQFLRQFESRFKTQISMTVIGRLLMHACVDSSKFSFLLFSQFINLFFNLFHSWFKTYFFQRTSFTNISHTSDFLIRFLNCLLHFRSTLAFFLVR